MPKTNEQQSGKPSSALLPKGRGLNLSHHRHSGRRLPHSHTSYPVLAMLLLSVGVLLSNASHLVSAATITDSGSYVVTAAYLGLPPATAATITAPVDGAQVKVAPITVSGTCPTDSYVTITRNGVNSGTAICGPQNTYSLQTDLFNGPNALLAHVYSRFDVAGPISNQLMVTYNAPVVVPPTASPPGSAAGSGSSSTPTVQPRITTPSQPGLPLLIKSNFQYVGHSLGQAVSYQFELVGGTAPYAININWGDGTTKTLSLTRSGPFSVSHTYDKASQYQSSFKIVATAGDAAGQQTLLQLLAIVNDRPTVPLAATTGNGSQPSVGLGQQLKNLMNYIWPTYGVVVLMFASFWFGELRELKLLRPKPTTHRHA